VNNVLYIGQVLVIAGWDRVRFAPRYQVPPFALQCPGNQLWQLTAGTKDKPIMEWVKETVITTAVSKISRFNQVVTISKTSTSGPRMNEIRRVR
jgi:hypothetical protein